MSPRNVHMHHTTIRNSAITKRSHFLTVFTLFGLVLALFGCRTSTHGATDGSVPPSRELVDLRSRILAYTARFTPGGNYTPPDRGERERIAQGVGRLLDGHAKDAERLLADVGLGITRLTDTASGRRYDEIAAVRSGVAEHWGRLYLNADSALRWSVQVPHPVADRDTELLGVRLLEDTPGGALVMAGAHRKAGRNGAADVSHREDSAFHTVIVELQRRGVPGLQLHGFARTSQRPYEAVVSTGAARSVLDETSALADRMEAHGLRVCRAWSARCPVEGTTNVQGRSAQRQHAEFVHVELAPGARGHGKDADAAAAALSGLTADWRDR
ncbi:hypothetical protein [Streptomyces sp. NPDC007264]|uniref:hypothetical protein n=1 Tax=Streptomyces sp. NPDC007264 TaxID=3364777 RepID=UPI0036DADDB3